MDVLTLLADAHRAGLTVLVEGDRLVVRGPRWAEDLARQVLVRKAAVVAALGGQVDVPENSDFGDDDRPVVQRCLSCNELDLQRPRAGGAWRCARCRPYDLPVAEIEWWPRVGDAATLLPTLTTGSPDSPPAPHPSRQVNETTDAHAPGPHVQGLLSTRPKFTTDFGAMYAGDAATLLAELPENSVELVFTSPPYALQTQKEYGNVDKAAYVQWFEPFGKQIYRVLKPEGSFVLNIGGSYNPGTPTRSLYQYRLLLMLCDRLGFHIAQECFWFNPAKLPCPAAWVNVARCRIKDSVEYLWWLAKTPNPRADNRQVLVPYCRSMQALIQNGGKAAERPSGHKIKASFRDRGGAIPANLIVSANTDSNSEYFRLCKQHDMKPHPARCPSALPDFFIRLLTVPDAVVVDPFGGSNTTGSVAESLGRRWLSFEIEPRYVDGARLRFGLSPTRSSAEVDEEQAKQGLGIPHGHRNTITRKAR